MGFGEYHRVGKEQGFHKLLTALLRMKTYRNGGRVFAPHQGNCHLPVFFGIA